MGISGNVVFEVRNGGSDTNGGGFVTGSGGTDYSQQNSPQLSLTDAVCAATTTVTSATGGFTAAMVGSIIYLDNGGTCDWYEIKTRVDTNTITIDRAGPSASGLTLNVGGALATPGLASWILAYDATSGGIAFLKYSATPYDVSASPGAHNEGGGWFGSNYDAGSMTSLCGYDTTRSLGNTDANRPTMRAVSDSVNLVTSGDRTPRGAIYNIIVDGNSHSNVIGFSSPGYGGMVTFNCKAINCKRGFQGAGAVNGYAESCSDYGFYFNAEGFGGQVGFSGCVAKSCTGGFYLFYTGASDCIAWNCTNYGFSVGGTYYGNGIVSHCTAYGTTSGPGFYLPYGAGTAIVANCLSVSNSTYGLYCDSAGTLPQIVGFVTYGNTSGDIGGSTIYGYPVGNTALMNVVVGAVSLSTSPFTDPSTGDFSLKAADIDTPGTGAYQLKNSGYPSIYPGTTTATYFTPGASQPMVSSAGVVETVVVLNQYRKVR
jgi:hypothetical protein